MRTRFLALGVVLALAALCMSCSSGVGVGLGYSYPGRIYGPVGGGGTWSGGGGPVWN